MKKNIQAKLLALSTIVSVALFASSAQADCPRSEQNNAWVEACQLGENIQVLYHNDNDYAVTFSAKITYTDGNGQETKWVEATGRANNGGQVTVFTVKGLKEVTDIEMRNFAKQN